LENNIILVFIALFFVGSFTGLASGFLGIGGGVIVVPVMLYYFAGKVEPSSLFFVATATSLSVAIFTASFSTIRHIKNKNLFKEAVLPLALGAFIGTFPGNYLVTKIPGEQLYFAFSILLLLISIKMFFEKKIIVDETDTNLNFTKLLLTGMGVGTFSVLTGLGGGVVLVPILSLLFKFPLKKAVGTTAFVMLFNTIPGVLGRIYSGYGLVFDNFSYNIGYLIPLYSIPLIIGAAIFAPIGAQLNFKLDNKIFKKIAGLLFFVISIKMILGFIL